MAGLSTLDGDRSLSQPIDPRIRARRIEVRRHEGRRRLQRVLDLGLLTLVAALFGASLWSPLLDVDALQVSGTVRLEPAAVLAAAGIEAGEPLVGVDLRTAGERIAALPWVEEVHLSRRLDGTVELRISERSPVALLGAGSSALLVDIDGRVLAPLGDMPEAGSLPRLGYEGSTPPIGDFLPVAVGDALALAGRLALVAPGIVSEIAVHDLSATLERGGMVVFGDAGRLDAKITSLTTMLDQVDLSCLVLLDLRLPGSPVLTREDGCS